MTEKTGRSFLPIAIVCVTPVCKKERVGGGTVTRLLDEHMSVVKIDAGVPFKEGTVVEKE